MSKPCDTIISTPKWLKLHTHRDQGELSFWCYFSYDFTCKISVCCTFCRQQTHFCSCSVQCLHSMAVKSFGTSLFRLFSKVPRKFRNLRKIRGIRGISKVPEKIPKKLKSSGSRSSFREKWALVPCSSFPFLLRQHFNELRGRSVRRVHSLPFAEGRIIWWRRRSKMTREMPIVRNTNCNY